MNLNSKINLLFLAVRNVLNRGKRSWLTVIGVFIGIAAVVALVSLGQGLEQTVVSEFESLGADNLYVFSGSGFGGESVEPLTDRDIDVIENVRGVDIAGGLFLEQGVDIEFRGEEKGIALIGLPEDSEEREMIKKANTLSIEKGRELRSTDLNNAVVGKELTNTIYENSVDIRSQLSLENRQLRTVGIYQATGDPIYDSAVFTNLNTVREITSAEENELSNIIVRVQDGFDPENVKPDVEREMRRERGVAEGDETFNVLTVGQALEQFTNILNIVQSVVIGLASISLAVGAVGIMNTMYMSVTERTKEIGVMKAIGATNKQIRNLFLIESGLIGLIGGIIGVIIGIIFSEIGEIAINSYTDFGFAAYYPIWLIVSTTIFSFIIGMISGYLPAKRAFTLTPVEALRDD